MRFFLAFMVLCGGAFAQTTPGFIAGQTPTAALWNSYFGAKADTNNGTLNSATLIAPTFSGGLTVDALTVTAGGALAGTFSGAPTLSGAPTFSGTPVFSAGGALTGTFSGTPTFSGASVFSAAGTALTVTNNASLGGTLTTGAGVTNGMLLSGTTLSVTGTGNPNLTVRSLGVGSIVFQSGATPVTAVQITDGGAGAVNFLRYQPGTTGNGGTISVLGDAAAIMKLHAGTSGGYIDAAAQPFAVGAISQHNTYNLAGVNPADRSTAPFTQLTTITGNNGASTNTNGINFFSLTDQAAVTGSLGIATFSQNYTTGADGDRNMVDMIFTKNVASASGNHIFALLRPHMHIEADEGGTGTAITASQAGTLLTVATAVSSVLAVNSVVSGVGMVTQRILSLGTGTGGAGTYNVNKDQTIGLQDMVAGNYKGNAEGMNPDMKCNGGLWWKGCQFAEIDIRDYADSQYKTGIDVHYAVFDVGHGVSHDCAYCISSVDLAPGVGKGRVMFSVGSPDQTWPVNTADTNSAILRAQPHTFRQLGVNPALYAATFGIDFTILECGTACWRSPGFTIDGAGQIAAGPLTVAYAAAGATISAPRVTTASAVVVSGGSSFVLHDEVLEPLTGSLWDVATLSGSAVATLTLTKAGFATSCPGAATPFTSLGNGISLTATITCSTSNGIVLAGAAEKIGFYGATAIVKATPVGACAGSTGCQALRDALGNLGLINTGSITD